MLNIPELSHFAQWGIGVDMKRISLFLTGTFLCFGLLVTAQAKHWIEFEQLAPRITQQIEHLHARLSSAKRADIWAEAVLLTDLSGFDGEKLSGAAHFFSSADGAMSNVTGSEEEEWIIAFAEQYAGTPGVRRTAMLEAGEPVGMLAATGIIENNPNMRQDQPRSGQVEQTADPDEAQLAALEEGLKRLKRQKKVIESIMPQVNPALPERNMLLAMRTSSQSQIRMIEVLIGFQKQQLDFEVIPELQQALDADHAMITKQIDAGRVLQAERLSEVALLPAFSEEEQRLKGKLGEFFASYDPAFTTEQALADHIWTFPGQISLTILRADPSYFEEWVAKGEELEGRRARLGLERQKLSREIIPLLNDGLLSSNEAVIEGPHA